MIQPINMVPSNENIKPSSSHLQVVSHPQLVKPLSIVDPTASSPEPTQDTTFLDNLVSHYSGELPEVRQHSEKASEVVSMETTSESPQHQSPN
jgi:hypothetical protein